MSRFGGNGAYNNSQPDSRIISNLADFFGHLVITYFSVSFPSRLAVRLFISSLMRRKFLASITSFSCSFSKQYFFGKGM